MCINNSHWQISGIIIFLRKYYIVILDTLVGFFLDVLFLLLLAVVIIRALWETRTNKDWVTEKVHRGICVRDINFWLQNFPSMSFLLLSSSTLLPKWRTCWMAPIKIHITIVGIPCGIENIKISWNLILADWHL